MSARRWISCLWLCGLSTWFAAVGQSSEWPKLQGPHGNGTAPNAQLFLDWGESGPPQLWKIEVARGFGGVAVRDGEVFLLDQEMGEADILRCLDLKTGEELWSSAYDAVGRLPFPGSRCVPTVEEEYVYTVGGFGQVACFDREEQEIAWMLDLREEYDASPPGFGYAQSAIVWEDLVIVSPLSSDVGLVAFDRFSGDEVWSTEGLGSSHSSPVLMTIQGEEQLLFVSSTSGMGSMRPEVSSPQSLLEVATEDLGGTGMVTSVHPEDGSLLWQTELYHCRLPIPFPLKIDEQRLFLTGGYRAGSMMISLQKTDQGWETEKLFEIERGAQIHQPMLVNDHLFVLVNENWNDPRPMQKEGGLLCLSLDGEEKWRTGNDPFLGRGNMLHVGDHLLIQDGHSGRLRVVEPSSEGFQVVAEANIFETRSRSDQQMWAPMAWADGLLLMRSQDELRCIDLREPDGE